MSVIKKTNPVVHNALIVFLKYPEKGYVKTRLAKDIGDEFTLKIYKTLIRNTLSLVKSFSDTQIYVFYSFNKNKILFNKKKINKDWIFVEQSQGDLGKKMENAFQIVFDSGIKKALIIGTDIIGLTKDIIEDAFKSLEKDDIVIGQTEDGGYYLIGMKQIQDVFINIPWSTNKVFKRTLIKIHHLELDVKILPILFDIDLKDDWERAKIESPGILKFLKYKDNVGLGL